VNGRRQALPRVGLIPWAWPESASSGQEKAMHRSVYKVLIIDEIGYLLWARDCTAGGRLALWPATPSCGGMICSSGLVHQSTVCCPARATSPACQRMRPRWCARSLDQIPCLDCKKYFRRREEPMLRHLSPIPVFPQTTIGNALGSCRGGCGNDAAMCRVTQIQSQQRSAPLGGLSPPAGDVPR
jgi:hypothetical protein